MDKSPKKGILFLVSIVILQNVFVFENYQRNHKNEFVVFHKSRKSILGIRNKNQTLIYHNLSSQEIKKSKILETYKTGEAVDLQFKNNIPNILNFKNQQVLIIDSLGIYKINGLFKPIIILQNSPKINLERLINILNPKIIVADGSNYKSYVNTWKEICEYKKTPFHNTNRKGAYILKK